MSSVDSRMVQPMVIGGVVMGVASSVPGLNCLNLCCCLFGLAGGALAAFLFYKDTSIPEPAPYGPAAMLGGGAGAIGGVIVTVLGTLVQMAMGGMQANMDDMQELFDQLELSPEAQQFMEGAIGGSMSPGVLVVSFFMNLVLYALFGALGAILLVSFMQKKGGGGAPGAGYGPVQGQGPMHGQGPMQGTPPVTPPAGGAPPHPQGGGTPPPGTPPPQGGGTPPPQGGGTPPPPSAPPSKLPPPPQ